MTKHIVVLLLICLMTAGCMPFSGRYGPFELMIKAENGERVEDVLVTLYRGTPNSFEGTTTVYHERSIGNTDEVIVFPRGLVNRADLKKFFMQVSIIHPYYGLNDSPHVSFPRDRKNKIQLGTKIIASKDSMREQSVLKITEGLLEQGLTNDQIRKQLRIGGKRKWGALDIAIRGYFTMVLELGRGDLIDKYLPLMINDYIQEDGGDIDPVLLEEELRRRIQAGGH
jgi:hypothetical protein